MNRKCWVLIDKETHKPHVDHGTFIVLKRKGLAIATLQDFPSCYIKKLRITDHE